MRKKSSPSSLAGKPSNGANGSHGAATLAPPKSTSKKKKEIPVIQRVEMVPAYDPMNGFLDNRELLRVLTEVKAGNFGARMPFDQIGLSGKVCDTLNEIIALNEKMMNEFTRAGQIIGKQGKLNQRIEVPSAKGSWGAGEIPSTV
jgi:hypothetical protein